MTKKSCPVAEVVSFGKPTKVVYECDERVLTLFQ